MSLQYRDDCGECQRHKLVQDVTEARKEDKLSLREFATKIGIDASYWSKVERGKLALHRENGTAVSKLRQYLDERNAPNR